MPADKVIKFFHGASTGIEGKITDGQNSANTR